MSFQARLYDPKEVVIGVSENLNFLTQLTHINFQQYFHLLLILTHTPLVQTPIKLYFIFNVLRIAIAQTTGLQLKTLSKTAVSKI